jgi:hypothetical protein
MSDQEYREAMKNSFVRRIWRHSPLANRYYYRGPDWSGTGPNLIRPHSLVEQIRHFRQSEDERIYMTGYSRGAAIVINAAVLLRDQRIFVEAMFLFDAVDRSFELDADFIPSNVRNAYHAIRDSSTGSRESFGNCGLQYESGVSHDPTQPFFTTHGGMGGTPWGAAGLPGLQKTIEYAISDAAGRARLARTTRIDEGGIDGGTNVTLAQEVRGMNQVRAWMWERLRKHRVLS